MKLSLPENIPEWSQVGEFLRGRNAGPKAPTAPQTALSEAQTLRSFSAHLGGRNK